MLSNTRNGVIITLAAALLAERVLAKLPRHLWFVSVFLVAYMAARFCLPSGTSPVPEYFEDMFFGLAVCIGLGVLAWHADAQISVYTGKHGGPAIPAFVFALVYTLTAGTH